MVKCGGCGAGLDESAELPAVERTPCPECGSTVRLKTVDVGGSIRPEGRYLARARHPGKNRYEVELTQGYTFHRKSGRLHFLKRVIDRVQQVYKERITDAETGQLIRECSEPLEQHTNRGAAKRASERDP